MDTGSDTTGFDTHDGDSTGGGWTDPDASDDGSPASSFPGAGKRVDADDRAAALAAEPDGNATTADMVDTDAVDSSAHEAAPGSDDD